MFHRFLLVEFTLGERPKRTPPLRMEKMDFCNITACVCIYMYIHMIHIYIYVCIDNLA